MSHEANLLIIDDEKNIREGIKLSLQQYNYQVFLASNGEEGLKKVNDLDLDLVITDLKMPVMDGETFLKEMNKDDSNIPVIILTGHGTIENAVKLMHDGAYDFLTKPINLEKLALIVKRALSQRQLIIENRNLQSKIQTFEFGKIIGKSQKMMEVFTKIEQVASTRASVLIEGENGVGKEVVANMIYELSNRKGKPFIKVHCAALSENLLESELFGHEKGAFTGAIKTKKGRFELAHGGTIFLDEIGEISQSIQVKLLRIIQEKSFERVGGEETINVDVRIISATNLDLKEEVSKGNFREDLFYRLNVIPLYVPSLRERREDIPLFISNFITEFAKENNRIISEITSKTKSALLNYQWPGNVRELRNVIESAVVLSSDDIIDLDDLPSYIAEISDEDHILKMTLPQTILAIEKQAIINTLKITKGNKSKASELLGITRKTLQNKINDYQIIIKK